jgi:hypothetical protein
VTIDAERLREMIAEDDLGLLVLPVKAEPLSADQRLVASFEEISAFVRQHGREPAADARDIAEIKLYHRLEGLRSSEVNREALAAHDAGGLLREPEPPGSLEEALASDPLGILDAPAEDIHNLQHVPKAAARPDRVAQRKRAENFEEFEPLFTQCQAELRSGVRRLVAFRNEQEIKEDTFYVLRGQLVYVAGEGERRKEHGRINTRLHCVFENGTEADLLLRSFSSQLYRFGKAVTDPSTKTGDEIEERLGQQRGYVYVLRSLSNDSQVAPIPDLHKIGYTSQPPEARVRGASGHATFLGAAVELVDTYEMPRAMARGVEGLLHRFFAASRLDTWFERDGKVVAEAKEWFAVPAEAVREAIGLIQQESIENFRWDPESRLIGLRDS